MSAPLPTTVVVPTVGRRSLYALLAALVTGRGPRPERIVLVDDTPGGKLPTMGLPEVTPLRSGGRGPAAARNVGWRHARTPWVSFLDDDVVPAEDWLARLGDELRTAQPDLAGIQGTVEVPLPTHRPPTDWERTTSGLAASDWITADMTYRRCFLARVGGFDERFPRAYREDSDLALRVMGTGGRLVKGTRRVSHPVRSADAWVSVRQQAGNADDVLMTRLHGPDWRSAAGAPRGRRHRHVAITAAAVAAAGCGALGLPRLAGLAATGWLAGVVELAWARIAPGPRTAPEVRRMLLTSAVIPFAATWHTARGGWRHRAARPWHGLPDLVLFDRDGTLVHNVPYNSDPTRVMPVLGARRALDLLRSRGIRVGVVTNQSGIGTGRITSGQVDAVNARIGYLLGPFDTWQVCPHGPYEGCGCRKPAPGMVKRACADLDVDPSRCVVIGDTAADVAAAEAAGATGILVPNPATRPDEVAAARHVRRDLTGAADRILGGAW
ncbi:MAG TPA: HAD-IIIA family hydrolase [Micromonosporaceae bacterium]